ncbi:MAG: hypothetical protein WC213_00195 [Arenimonas sp.]|jgi:hypothetical protein
MSEQMQKLVMGSIVCMGPNDEEAIPYDEAVIHFEGDEDSEIRINCPGALRLAPKIVTAVNEHDGLVARMVEATRLIDEGSDNMVKLMAAEAQLAKAMAVVTEIANLPNGQRSHGDIGVLAVNKTKALLADVGNVGETKT